MQKRNYPIDKDAIREIELWIKNTAEIYFKTVIPLLENYTKKYVRGTFDKNKGIKGFELVIPVAVRSYYREFGDKMQFNPEERKISAKDLYDYYEDIMKEMFKKAKKLKKTSKK